MSVLETALAYAVAGLPVFPCAGKKPLVDHGLHDATTDREMIERWWRRWPSANVALRTGAASGLLVIDADDLDSLHELEREHGALPRTRSVVTPRGGEHYWLRHPGGEIRSSAGKLAPGVDVRAEGGYVVAPPSPGYVVDDEAPLADPPGWLLERLQSGHRNAAAPKVGEVIPKGQRNTELASLAGTMRRRGMGAAEIAAALQVANRERCQPPLDDQEVERIAASVARYEPAALSSNGFATFPSTPRGDANDGNPETPGSGPTEPFAAPMSEKLAGVPPEPNWLWDGYLSPGAITLLAGRPKVGKTTLLFPLIAALEQGRPFLDRPTFATRVLMLSEEREQTLAEKRQLYLAGADPLLLMRHEQAGRGWPELVAQARVYCDEHDVGVLLIDTWDKWTGLRGDDESKAGAVIEALEPLMLAAGDGLAVLIVAHQRKAAGRHGEAVRGSNAITGGVDVIVELERAPEELGRRMRVLRAESRFTATPEELVGELTEDGGYVAQGELEEVKREAEGESIAELVTEAPGLTVAELAEAADVGVRTLERKLKAALEDGFISRTGTGRKGDAYRWHPREGADR